MVLAYGQTPDNPAKLTLDRPLMAGRRVTQQPYSAGIQLEASFPAVTKSLGKTRLMSGACDKGSDVYVIWPMVKGACFFEKGKYVKTHGYG